MALNNLSHVYSMSFFTCCKPCIRAAELMSISTTSLDYTRINPVCSLSIDISVYLSVMVTLDKMLHGYWQTVQYS